MRFPTSVAMLAASLVLSLEACASGGAPPSVMPGPPSDTAELFGVGVFSTGDYELPPTFTPDGRTAYFSLGTPVYGRHRLIVETHRRGDGWTDLVVASFSGEYDDVDPFISPDWSRLFFLSKRPVTGSAPESDLDIWVMDRAGDGWGPPRHLGETVNGPADEHYVTSTRDGTLYISGIREDSRGAGDVYRVPRIGDGYGAPENLGPVVNRIDLHDTTPYVAPDESYVIFGSRGRADGLGDIDLYITFRSAAGSWTEPRNLGARVNSSATDFCPVVSPDGRWLYFASTRHSMHAPLAPSLRGSDPRQRLRAAGNTLADTYRVPLAPLLEEMRGRR